MNSVDCRTTIDGESVNDAVIANILKDNQDLYIFYGKYNSILDGVKPMITK